jgi:hypothetical protein
MAMVGTANLYFSNQMTGVEMFGKKPKANLSGWKYEIEPTGIGSGSMKQWRANITDPDGGTYNNDWLGILDYVLVYGKDINKAEKRVLAIMNRLQLDRETRLSVTIL